MIKYDLIDEENLTINKLSEGQNIARAVALQPFVICLDEPTSALDPLLTNFVAENIEKLAV